MKENVHISENYESPQIELFEMSVESGFAASVVLNDYAEGETDWLIEE